MWRSPRSRPCPLQFSAQCELVVPTDSSASSQLQGTSLKCFWSCQELIRTLRAAGSRNSGATMDKSREKRLGWDLQSPGTGERDKICIGFLTGQRPCASSGY